ncbi:methyl-accepting chemotaxis protein, partial [Pseudomonas shirazensis]
MTASKHGVLANLGMARKLGLGFALVLLLTLAVAAIGVASLYSVSQRFDSLRQMTQFNSDLLRLRQHEQGFALRSDSEEADKLRSGLQNLLERARGVPRLSATEADLSAYGQAFDAFVEV